MPEPWLRGLVGRSMIWAAAASLINVALGIFAEVTVGGLDAAMDACQKGVCRSFQAKPTFCRVQAFPLAGQYGQL